MAIALWLALLTHVANLEGSIFAWANEDRPLVQGDGEGAGAPTSLVHPYDADWGNLVAPEHRADPP